MKFIYDKTPSHLGGQYRLIGRLSRWVYRQKAERREL